MAVLTALGSTKVKDAESATTVGIKKDRLTAMTAVTAVGAVVYAYRGFKGVTD